MVSKVNKHVVFGYDYYFVILSLSEYVKKK